MKLVRIAQGNGTTASCIQVGNRLTPLPAGTSILDVLAMAPAERTSLEAELQETDTLDIAAVRLLPPILPTSLKDFMGFERHFLGALKHMFPQGGGPGHSTGEGLPPSLYEQPMYYVCDNSQIQGPADDFTLPSGTREMCCELELAAVMAHGGRDLTPEQAGAAIGGYTLFLDWSARDILRKDGLGPSKGKDAGNTLGPAIVTKDEIEQYRVADRLKVPMTLRRNDELIGEGDTEESIYSIEEMIAWVSRSANIRPGDVIAMGTAPNMCWVEHWGNNGGLTPAPIAAGDVIHFEAGAIGSMAIKVRPPVAHVELPRARSYL